MARSLRRRAARLGTTPTKRDWTNHIWTVKELLPT